MSDKVYVIPQGGVTLEIGGVKRVLRYPLRALKMIGEKHGINMLTNGGDLFTAEFFSSLENLVYMLWQGFVHAEKDLKEDEIWDWFDPNNLPMLTNAIVKAMGVSFDEPSTDKAEEPAGDEGEEKKD